MPNTLPTLVEAIPLLFFHQSRAGERELTLEEVWPCARWMMRRHVNLAFTLQEMACLVQLLGQSAPRLSLAALGSQTEDLHLTTYGYLLDEDELLHETDPQAWTWEAWTERHAENLLRLLLLALLHLEVGSPQAAQRIRSGLPWPAGLDFEWR